MDRLNQNSNGTTLHLILLSSSIIFIICFLLTQLVTVKVEISFLHFFFRENLLGSFLTDEFERRARQGVTHLKRLHHNVRQVKKVSRGKWSFSFYSSLLPLFPGWIRLNIKLRMVLWSLSFLSVMVHAIYKKKDDFFVCKSCKNHHLNVGPSGSFLSLMAAARLVRKESITLCGINLVVLFAQMEHSHLA